MTAESRLAELGIDLPGPTTGTANRAGVVRSGNHLYLSGHGPVPTADGTILSGKVGADLTSEQGYEAGRLTGLALLGTIRAELGSLDRVTRVVKLLGMVNVAPGFNQTSGVVDGCSDLMVEVFGSEIGRHARSAVGMAELPLDFPVEIEAIVEIAGDA
jgi:enamine deaminase RidA (YjgF/YER057c/UK114 family)